MTLILKSDNIFGGEELAKGYTAYAARVEADGGQIVSSADATSAFMFINSLGLTASQCFSVTSARWGVKKTGGLVSKVYSLFGSAGDLVPDNEPANYYDEGGVLGVEFKEDLNKILRTVGSITSKSEVALHAAYKTGVGETRDTILSLANDYNRIEVDDPQIILLRTSVNDNSYLALYDGPTTELRSPYSGDGKVKTSSSILTEGTLKLLASGGVMGSITANASSVVNNLFMYVGAATPFSSKAALVGVVTEAWCVLDASLDQSKAISKRLTTSYVV